MVLGSAEVTPYEVAVAFSTLANQGIRVTPKPINRIVNQEGETLERRSIQVEQVVPPDVAYMITHLMEGVIEHGTARQARKMGFDRPAAGKTGTTNDYGDAWFVGFTPDLVAVVWVGFDHRESLKLTGGQAALPMWTEFMKRATEGQAVVCFSPPPGIRIRWRDAADEESAVSFCPSASDEAFYSDETYQFESQPRFRPIPVEAELPSSSSSGSASTQPAKAAVSSPSAPSELFPRETGEKKPWWRLF
jgi:membrane carboxypeptidase/penicillin-binding protein